jgi:hypothetical protein
LTDTCIALDVLDRSSEIGGFADPARTAFYDADVDYECYDLATGQTAEALMFYSGGRWLNAEAQDRLRDYVESGGHLVFFDKLPVQDDTLHPLNRLSLVEPDNLLPGMNLTLTLGEQKVALGTARCFNYSQVEVLPGEPIHAARQLDGGYHAEEQRIQFHTPLESRYITGYHEQRGSGSITVLGMPPHPALILALHQWLDIPVYSRSGLIGVATALYRRDEMLYLIATNNASTERDVIVELHRETLPQGVCTVRDLWRDTAYEADVRREGLVRLHLPGKSGTVLAIAPK